MIKTLNVFVLIFIILFFVMPGEAIAPYEEMEKAKIEEEKVLYKVEHSKDLRASLMEHIKSLSNDSMEGRRAGTAGADNAALYLVDKLKKMGFAPEDIIFQEVAIPKNKHIYLNGRLTFKNSSDMGGTSRNVLGIINGKSDETIILSAHYDHLGMFNGELYPGANDNASGVSCLLEITRLLKEWEQPEANIVIAFWTGEEMGLFGSRHYIRNPLFPLYKSKVINIDTIGSSNKYFLWNIEKTSFATYLLSVAKNKGVKMVPVTNNGRSDHAFFGKWGIPAVTIISEDWLEGNHEPNDTPEQVNIDSVQTVINFIIEVVEKLGY